MKRRSFFSFAALTGLGLTTRSGSAQETADGPDADSGTVDPYFLDTGEVSAAEEQQLLAYMDFQERQMAGEAAVLPRGGRPKRAASYRLLHWDAELGDPDGRLLGALSVSPNLPATGPYTFNAQILGFNTSSRTWRGGRGQGTLSIELRARYQDEPMTWLYLEQFEAMKRGANSIGLEYVAQRGGLPEAVVCEDPNIDLRIQLIRHRKAPGALRKILQIGAYLAGLPPVGSAIDDAFNNTPPVLRVPRMVREGVAFTQATVGGMSEEAPIWRSGFNSFAIASGGGRLALRPGLWVAIDDVGSVDFSKLVLEDVGGRVGLLQDGEPVDTNYLVLSMEIQSAAETDMGVTRKGAA